MPQTCQATLNRTSKIAIPTIITLLLFMSQSKTIARDNGHLPEIRNIHAQQRFGTRLADITFDLFDLDEEPLSIMLSASEDNGGSYTITPRTLRGDVGEGIHPGEHKRIIWDVGVDLQGVKNPNLIVRLIVSDSPRLLEEITSEKDGARMRLIPAGEFEMGDPFNEDTLPERPVHTVSLDDFYMDAFEVSNAQFKKFVDANPEWSKDFIPREYHDRDYLKDWDGNNYPSGQANYPVTWVSWYATAAYAQWVEKRLPTEAEWEKAARGGLVDKRYPNGNTITRDEANYTGIGGRDQWHGASPVGSFPPNGYGLYDMAGNVWDWCMDEFIPLFYLISPRNNPLGGEIFNFVGDDFTRIKNPRSLRGGSFEGHTRHMRLSLRVAARPTYTDVYVGFRCVKTGNPFRNVVGETPSFIVGAQEGTPSDVNRDGVVDIFDLVLVGNALGTAGIGISADVDGNGLVDVFDLVIVAKSIEAETSAAPQLPVVRQPIPVTDWLVEAQAANDGSAGFQQGIAFLENLLMLIIPEGTKLFPNYPNPFNPETWIPYQLSEASSVTMTIYDTLGNVAKRLELGYQPKGVYRTPNRAAHWDGVDKAGEPVASGVYFVQLRTKGYQQTRRMVLLK
jgi:formylglycine-generating enzyme required for sulfatase activity